METSGLMEILLAAIIYFDLARKEKDRKHGINFDGDTNKLLN